MKLLVATLIALNVYRFTRGKTNPQWLCFILLHLLYHQYTLHLYLWIKTARVLVIDRWRSKTGGASYRNKYWTFKLFKVASKWNPYFVRKGQSVRLASNPPYNANDNYLIVLCVCSNLVYHFALSLQIYCTVLLFHTFKNGRTLTRICGFIFHIVGVLSWVMIPVLNTFRSRRDFRNKLRGVYSFLLLLIHQSVHGGRVW